MLSGWSEKAIVVVAAGTGGHVFPALAVADRVQSEGAEVFWLGTPQGMEHRLLKDTPFQVIPIDFVGFLGKGILRWLSLPWRLLRAFCQASSHLRAIRNRKKEMVVLVMGGYVTLPVALAARFWDMPVVVHEQNAHAGMANYFNAYLAQAVCQAFAQTFAHSDKLHTTGNPLRSGFIAKQQHDFSQHGFSSERPLRILCVGGSLGAAVFNKAIPMVAAHFQEQPVMLRLQCGKNVDAVSANVTDKGLSNLTVMAFIDDMQEAYQWADVVIARSGALTVSELIAVKLPAILVPFPFATNDHQTLNAQHLVHAEAAWMIVQTEQLNQALEQCIEQILQEPQLLVKMHKNMLEIGVNSADEKVAQICLDTLINKYRD